MKVQIIYLDRQDDHASARDKLNWSQAPRLVLVWPSEGAILNRRLDLLLIQRHAHHRGSQIALVTHDPEVRDLAATLGIPALSSLDELTDESWRRSARRRRRPPSRPASRPEAISILQGHEQRPPSHRAQLLMGVARWALFALAMIALLGVAAALLPSAEIVAIPTTERRELKLEIILDPSARLTASSGRIPARQVRMRLMGESSTATSGTVSTARTYATGQVTFTNLTSEPLTIPSGTGLRSSEEPAIRFTTTASVTLPATPGTTAETSIRATSPGTLANVPIGAIDSVDGPLGLSLAVTNFSPTSGGANETRPGVSQQDQDSLKSTLSDQLLAQSARSILGDLEPGDRLAEDSLRVSDLYAERFDHQVGEAADTLSLALDIQVTGLAFRQLDLETAIGLALTQAGAIGWKDVPETLSLQILTSTSMGEEGAYTLSVLASQWYYEPVDEATVLNAVSRRSPGEAADRLEQDFHINVIDVRLQPRWMPFLPWLPSRTTLRWNWEGGS